MELNPGFDVWSFFDNNKEECYAVCRLCTQHLKNDRTYCLRQHLRKVHSTKSDVMKYFKFIPAKGAAECRTCKQLVRNNRSNNLERHAEKHHNIKIRYFKKPVFINTLALGKDGLDLTDIDSLVTALGDESIEQLVDETKENQSIDYENTSEDQSVDLEKLQAIADSQYEGKDSKMKEKMLDIVMDKQIIKSAVWGLMIDEGVQPSLFGSNNMQSLTKPICDAISAIEDKECKIDSEESERMLYSVANQLRKDLSNELHWRLLSLKIDMDFKGPERTYCVSVSFVHEGRLQKRILGVIDLEGDPQLTGNHIRQVLNKYNIDPNQIVYACWDDTKSKYNTTVSNSEYLKEIESMENHPKILFNDIQIERYIGVLAHLCLMDVLKHPAIFELFSHCRNFVKFLSNESNGFLNVFKQKELPVPQLDSPWKWGSTFKMMDELREARKILETEFVYPKMELVEDQFDINENFWLFVDAFCESLRPIQKSIYIFYSNEMHFGDCYGQWLKTKIVTGRLSLKYIITNQYANLLTSEALKCIKTRTSDFLVTDAFQACLYMDPRFQHTLSSENMSVATEFLKKLWSKSEIYNPEDVNVVDESRREHVHLSELNVDENDLLNDFLCQDLPQTKSTTTRVYSKIDQLRLPFESVDTSVLCFWERHKTAEPEMARLSEICFAIPATQNYNQRRYTHIYKTQPNRKLPQPTMDNLATIRLNPHLVDDVSKWFDTNEENSHVDDN